jgi:hypothetical protein
MYTGASAERGLDRRRCGARRRMVHGRAAGPAAAEARDADPTLGGAMSSTKVLNASKTLSGSWSRRAGS